MYHVDLIECDSIRFFVARHYPVENSFRRAAAGPTGNDRVTQNRPLLLGPTFSSAVLRFLFGNSSPQHEEIALPVEPAGYSR